MHVWCSECCWVHVELCLCVGNKEQPSAEPPRLGLGLSGRSNTALGSIFLIPHRLLRHLWQLSNVSRFEISLVHRGPNSLSNGSGLHIRTTPTPSQTHQIGPRLQLGPHGLALAVEAHLQSTQERLASVNDENKGEPEVENGCTEARTLMIRMYSN